MAALFKINKGNSANLPSQYTNGHCYFTIDEGKLYIDTKDNDATGRIVVNALKADQDGNGNVISSSYLPLTGGTLKGALTISSGALTVSTGNLTVTSGSTYTKALYVQNANANINYGNLNMLNTYFPSIFFKVDNNYDGTNRSGRFEFSYSGTMSMIAQSDSSLADSVAPRRYLSLYDNDTNLNYTAAIRDFDGTTWTTKYLLHSGNAYDLAPMQRFWSKDLGTIDRNSSSGFGNHSEGNEDYIYYYYPTFTTSSVYGDKYMYVSSGFRVLGGNALTYTDSSGTSHSISGTVRLQLGNNITSSTADGYTGQLYVYNRDSTYSCLSDGTLYLNAGTSTPFLQLVGHSSSTSNSATVSATIYPRSALGFQIVWKDVAGYSTTLHFTGPQKAIPTCARLTNSYTGNTYYLYHTGNITYSVDQPTGSFAGQLWLEPID